MIATNLVLAAFAIGGVSTPPAPPVARKIPFVITSPQGDRNDDYYWMRDDNARAKRSEVLEYLTAENAYTDTMMAPLAPLQEALLKEMRGRMQEDDQSPRVFDRGYWYWTQFQPGGEHPNHLRVAGTYAGAAADAKPEVLLDGTELATGKPYFSIGGFEVSPDNKWLAWTDDITGRRISSLHFKELATGRVSTESIPGVLEDIAWASDSRTIFYIKQDPVLLQSGPVFRHTVGTDPSTDTLVYEEPDKTLSTSVSASRSEEFILIFMDGFDTTELRAIRSSKPEELPAVVLPRVAGVRSYADHLNGSWVIRTNENAINFRLLEARPHELDDRSKWKELVPSRASMSLDDFVLFDEAIVVAERADANPRVTVLPWGAHPATKEPFTIDADKSAFAMSLDANMDPTLPFVRVQYTSMVTPKSIIDVDMSTRHRTVRKVQTVNGYDANKYDTARIWAPARDGKLIPVSIAWRKDSYKRDGTAPAYQEGYGAYGISSDAEFSSNQVSLMDRGFVLATAHVRGGADMGQEWYEDGRLSNKKHTFTDFEDVTDFLVKEKYASPKKVFATGGSAGGLLMGVIANCAGDKYRAIALHVPFVDALTTMLDETIPLTTNEWTQWGDPRQKAAYDYICSYSPYDNICRKAYPPMLVTTGLWDSQVQYYEPSKWVAKMRAMKTDQNPLLLRVNMDAGHGGNSGRFARLKQIAMEYAFFIDLLGMAGTGLPESAAKSSS